MKISQLSMLAVLLISSFAAAAPKLQVRASQLAGEWACEIKKQRDPIHTFAPTRISFVEMPRLPANLYIAYFERSFQESKESAPLRYLEYYEGFWNIKDGNRVCLRSRRMALNGSTNPKTSKTLPCASKRKKP